VLPTFLETVELKGLRIYGGSLDLLLRRHAQDVGIEIVRKEGEVRVTMVK